MDKQVKKSGFVIKLSNETVQKLQDTDAPAHQEPPKAPLEPPTAPVSDTKNDSVILPEIDKTSSAVDKPNSPIPDVDTEMKKPIKSGNSDKNADITPSGTHSEANWGEYAPYVTYEEETAVYTDPTTKVEYTWSTDSDSWALRNSSAVPQDTTKTYSYENDTHIYTEADGSKFFWDDDKKAWFPKVDDDFLAQYQMSYGFVDNTTKKEEKPEPTKTSESAAMKKKTADEPKWFDASEDKNNTKVYVSNLPDDMTEEEFVDLMQKYGLVMRDLSTQKMKVKLYYDKESNCFKGDALCTYIKIESVDLALKLLDGSDVRGRKIAVQRAQFQLKGDYNPALKPKKKKKKELDKLKRMQEKLFDWRPEKAVGERAKNERVVIVKNLFDPSDFDKEVQLILDYQQDLREECGKCGEVRKVVLYDRHPEGVAQITMKEPEQADAVVQLTNGRWFGKRKLTAEIWDGRTKYRIAETDADLNQRVNKWEKFLEGETDKKEANEKDGSGAKIESTNTDDSDKKGESVKKDENDKKGGSDKMNESDKKKQEDLKKKLEKVFDSQPGKAEDEHSNNKRVVIVKNLFDPSDVDKNVQLILDYQQDLTDECGKCGEVTKVVLDDRHPEGVAQVTMKKPEQAAAVVKLTNGRWFGKRKLTAEIWDGQTKYRKVETDAEMNQRVNKSEKFLEGETEKHLNEKDDKDKGDSIATPETSQDEQQIETKKVEKLNLEENEVMETVESSSDSE